MKAAPEGLLKPGDAAVLGIERKVQFQYLAFETEYRNVLRPAERLRIVMAGACRPGGRACQNPGICPQLSRRLPSSHYFFPHLQSIDLCDRMPGPHQPPRLQAALCRGFPFKPAANIGCLVRMCV